MILTTILTTILTFILCGDCVFLGVMSHRIFITFDPSFWGWGIACYVCAGFFGVLFIVDVARGIARRRRKKARQRGAGQQAARKTGAKKSGVQRKRSKRK